MMGLLNKHTASKLPKLYDTEHEPLEDKIARIKFFHPVSNWTWYVIEFDGEDLCWGLVSGHEAEFGYFSLAELNQVTGPFGLRIERDIFFRPTNVKELAAFGQGGLVY
jgi:hypothetical protein